MSTVPVVPFVGLRAFEQRDQRWFRGREREVAALLRRVRTNRFTAVVGASGTGKSSLVRAGILPILAEEGWVPIVAKPGAAPIGRLARALSTAAADADDRLGEARTYRFDATLRASAYGLGEIARTILPDAARIVLVIDQFEELFRFGEEAQGSERAGKAEEGRAFVELLLRAAAETDGRLQVIVTMRSDYFGDCSLYEGLAEAVSRSQNLVPLPSRDQLEQVIRGPVLDAGGTIDDALVQRLLLDVEEVPDRLPTLQHTLRRLWEAATGEPKHLSVDEYAKVGRIAGSIDKKAEQIAASLERADSRDAITLERVMKALTALDEHGRATRRQQPRSALLALIGEDEAGRKSLGRVLEALSAEDASFLQLGEGDDPEVDIGHEALIRSWRRLAGPDLAFRQGWLAEEQQDGEEWRSLVRRAREGSRLGLQDQVRTTRWLAKHHLGRVWAERYGDAWEAVEALRQRSATTSRWALSFLGLLLLGIISGGYWLWMTKKSAEEEARQQFKAAALATGAYARTIAVKGNARAAALLVRPIVPESRSEQDARFLPQVAATLADSLARPHETMRLRGHEEAVIGVAFSPDGRRLVSGSEDKTLRLWDAATGAPIGEPLRGHEEAVIGVAFSPDGQRLASGSRDKTLRLWDAATGAPIGEPLRGHEEAVIGVAFSPDGQRLASGSWDKTLRLWDAATGAPIGEPLRGHEEAVFGVAFSPDGRRLASGSRDKTLRLWDAATGAPIGEPLRGHEEAVIGVAFSPDGQRLASGSWDKTLRLWDAATGAPIGEPLRGHEEAVFGVAFSPDGRRLASGSRDKTLRLWDAATGAPIGEPLRGHEEAVIGVAFSPDGQRLASGSWDKTLRLWDAATGASIGEPLRGHEEAVIGVAFSPDGRRLVSGSWDKTLRLWDAATGAPIGEPLRGHEEGVFGVAFSPDGQRLVSGSEDKTLRLWDAATGAPIGEPLRGHEAAVFGVAFSPDGQRLASGSGDKTLRLWDAGYFTATLSELAAAAERLCPLSLAERRQLGLLDLQTPDQDKPLTPEQRRACGERILGAGEVRFRAGSVPR